VGGVRVGSASSDAGEPAGTRAGAVGPVLVSFSRAGRVAAVQENDVERASARGRRGRTPTDIPVRVPGRASRRCVHRGHASAPRGGRAGAPRALGVAWEVRAPPPRRGAFRRKVSISHLCSCLAPATVRGAARLRPPAPRPDELAAPSLTSTRGLCALDIAPEPVARLAAAPSRSPRAAPEARVCQSPANAEQKTASPLRGRAESLDRPTDARIARFASRPASALARNLNPRPARARGLGKCRRCRPGGRRQTGCTFSFGKSKNPKKSLL